jgi:hypothetical protein
MNAIKGYKSYQSLQNYQKIHSGIKFSCIWPISKYESVNKFSNQRFIFKTGSIHFNLSNETVQQKLNTFLNIFNYKIKFKILQKFINQSIN